MFRLERRAKPIHGCCCLRLERSEGARSESAASITSKSKTNMLYYRLRSDAGLAAAGLIAELGIASYGISSSPPPCSWATRFLYNTNIAPPPCNDLQQWQPLVQGIMGEMTAHSIGSEAWFARSTSAVGVPKLLYVDCASNLLYRGLSPQIHGPCHDALPSLIKPVPTARNLVAAHP